MDIHAAEDIVQEVFARLWDNRHFLSASDNLTGYLYVGVRNRCFNHLERRRTANRYLLNYVEDLHDADDADREKYVARLRTLFQKLPDKRREVLRLSIFEGKSYAEIAAITGISLNTVKDHIKKAYAYLRSAAAGKE